MFGNAAITLRRLAGLGFGGALTLAMSHTAQAGVVDRPVYRVGGLVVVMGGSDFREEGGRALVAGDFYSLSNVPADSLANDVISGDIITTNYNTGRFNASSDGRESNWEFEVLDPDGGGQFNSVGPHQTLGPEDSYTPFGVDGDTDIDLLGGGGRASQFLVASNTPFQIRAHATDLVNRGGFSALGYDNIRYRLRYFVDRGARHGSNAQAPHSGAGTFAGAQPGITFAQTGGSRWSLDDISAGPTTVFRGNQRTAARPGGLLSQAIAFQSRYNLQGTGVNGNTYDLSMGAGELGATVTYTIYTP